MRRGQRLDLDTPAGPLLAAPALAGLLLFVALPFALALGLSLTDARLGAQAAPRFIGLAQYATLLRDPEFRRTLANTLLFAAGIVPAQTALALGLALLLAGRQPGNAALRLGFFLPVAFPLSLVSVIWILILAPGEQGLLNALLGLLSGGAWRTRDFLRDPVLALPALMLVSLWQGVGLQMIILIAGLQGIPSARYEAAAVDGAGRWQRFRHVTLPGLRSPLAFVIVITTILAARLFDQVQIMTRGGPSGRTSVIVFATVRAVFERQQLARASAMTVLLALLVLGLALLQRRLLAGDRR